MRRSPLMRSITLTNANQNYNLYTLLTAVDTSFVLQHRCQALELQSDNSNGGANLYIGDPDHLSATDKGVQLVASQAFTLSMESNLIRLDDIALRSDTASILVNVTVVTR